MHELEKIDGQKAVFIRAFLDQIWGSHGKYWLREIQDFARGAVLEAGGQMSPNTCGTYTRPLRQAGLIDYAAKGKNGPLLVWLTEKAHGDQGLSALLEKSDWGTKIKQMSSKKMVSDEEWERLLDRVPFRITHQSKLDTDLWRAVMRAVSDGELDLRVVWPRGK